MKVQSTHEVVLERSKKAWELKDQGKSNADIAKEIGISSGALHYYLYQIGKPGKAKPVKRGVVSVLGSTVNGKSHDDWFVAGWVAAYATAKGLDPKTLIEDANRILEGKSHE